MLMFASSCADSVGLFTSAVYLVTTDDSFSVPSPVNRRAVETASALTLWCQCQENLPSLSHFSNVLCVRLHACFSQRHTSLKLRKEKMW